MGRYHKITVDARKLLHFNRAAKSPNDTPKDVAGKYRVIIVRTNGEVAALSGENSIKQALSSLMDVKRTMFATGWAHEGKRWDYKSYDIDDAWICQTANCPHKALHNGLSCVERVEQSTPNAKSKCLYDRCKVEFETSKLRKTYCSSKCRKANQNKAYYYGTHLSFDRNCLFCKKAFTTNRSDVECCSHEHMIANRLLCAREQTVKIEDAIKETMVSLFASNGHKPVSSAAILNVISVSHSVSRINTYLVKGNSKKWERVRPRFYIPLQNNQELI